MCIVVISTLYVTLLTLLPPKDYCLFGALGVRRGRKVTCFLSFPITVRESRGTKVPGTFAPYIRKSSVGGQMGQQFFTTVKLNPLIAELQFT